MLMDSPKTLRTFSSVAIDGFPDLRSIATIVLIPTPLKSDNVCWLIPNSILRFRTHSPIYSIIGL